MADDAPELPLQNDLHDGMAAARIAGYSWPEIKSFVAGRHDASQAAGYDPAEVRAHLGLGDPGELNSRLRTAFTRNLANAKGQ